MRLLKYLLLLTIVLVRYGDAEKSCPEGCTCEDSSIVCLNINNFARILEESGPKVLNSLTIKGCSTPIGKIDAFPTNFRTRSLEISACGLTGFGADAFKSLAGDLLELRLTNNSLNSVPFLQDLKNLEVLNLNRNSIETILESAFNGMGKLSELRLKGNKVCKLPSKALNEVKGSLELLDLGSNCFSSVPVSNLRSSVFLKHLDLSGNQIGAVKDRDFVNLPDLKEIRLSDNRISKIEVRSFLNVPMLTHFYIKQNELTEIDPAFLQSFKWLNVVDLSGNHLQKIPSLKNMAELKTVYLNGNSISQIDALTFSNDPKLSMIALQSNKIGLISHDSFHSLDSMSSLSLGENSLKSIESGIFDGMPNLQILGLHNNSIAELTSSSFSSLFELNSLDLSNNQLQKISAGTFTAQKKLNWLDLSNNHITSLENGAFSGPIAKILLNGNSLICDTSLDWFINFLTQYNIRTSLTHEQEATCAAPSQVQGVNLKELMAKRANDTLIASMKQIGIENSQQQRNNFLSNLLPALTGLNSGGTSGGNAPVLGALSDAIPSLRSLPGLNGIIPGANPNDPSNKNLEAAVEQFAEPLVRFSSGAQPAASDVSSLIKSIPNLVVNLPGYGNIDLRKVHPKLIEHVMNGGTIPGVSKEALDSLVKQIMQRVYAAAAIRQNLQVDPEIAKTLPPGGLKPEKYLRPLNELPESFMTKVMQGEPLPYLTQAQTDVVKSYYMSNLPSELPSSLTSSNMSSLMNPNVLKMFNMLPPGYNISKIPKEVIQSVMRGEMPDLALLPLDLQTYIRENMSKFVGPEEATPDISVEELLKELPKVSNATEPTNTPYDINDMDSDLVVQHKQDTQDLRLYIAAVLGIVSVFTLTILILFCIYVRKQKNLEHKKDVHVIH